MGQYHGMTYILNVKRFYFVQTQEKKSTLRCASLRGVEFFPMGKEERGGAAQGGFVLWFLFTKDFSVNTVGTGNGASN